MPEVTKEHPKLKLLYNEGEVAEILGVTKPQLAKWRNAGHFKASKLGRPVLYTPEQIEVVKKWLLNR